MAGAEKPIPGGNFTPPVHRRTPTVTNLEKVRKRGLATRRFTTTPADRWLRASSAVDVGVDANVEKHSYSYMCRLRVASRRCSRRRTNSGVAVVERSATAMTCPSRGRRHPSRRSPLVVGALVWNLAFAFLAVFVFPLVATGKITTIIILSIQSKMSNH